MGETKEEMKEYVKEEKLEVKEELIEDVNVKGKVDSETKRDDSVTKREQELSVKRAATSLFQPEASVNTHKRAFACRLRRLGTRALALILNDSAPMSFQALVVAGST